MAITAPKNDDEARTMRDELAVYDRRRAEERNAERREFLKPLQELVDSDAFKEVERRAGELTPTYAAEDAIDVHLRHLPGFMSRLRDAIAVLSPAPLPAPTDAPAGTGDAGGQGGAANNA